MLNVRPNRDCKHSAQDVAHQKHDTAHGKQAQGK